MLYSITLILIATFFIFVAGIALGTAKGKQKAIGKLVDFLFARRNGTEFEAGEILEFLNDI